MTKLLESPEMSLDLIKELYTPDIDVIVYKQAKTLNYSFPTFEDATKALLDFSNIIHRNGMDIRMTMKSGYLNHIITLRQNVRL